MAQYLSFSVFILLQIFEDASSSAVGCRVNARDPTYNGKLNATMYGIPCQAWSSQNPRSHIFQNADFLTTDGGIVQASNYCRNPDNHAGGPWCYTAYGSNRWGKCAVPSCSANVNPQQDCLRSSTDRYLGGLTDNIAGLGCQAWSTNSPHLVTQHPVDGVAHNRCRNPDNTVFGPWCYTLISGMRYMPCGVFPCKGPCVEQGCLYEVKEGYTQNWIDPPTVTKVTTFTGCWYECSLLVNADCAGFVFTGNLCRLFNEIQFVETSRKDEDMYLKFVTK